MYNVSVGPSKIVAKTRRGIAQNLESFQNFSRKPVDFDNGEVMNCRKKPKEATLVESSPFAVKIKKKNNKDKLCTDKVGPRPVFHTNIKKCSSSKQQEIISPQHEELIRFISESWSKIFKEYESDGLEDSETFSASNSSSSIMYYEDTEPNAFLQTIRLMAKFKTGLHQVPQLKQFHLELKEAFRHPKVLCPTVHKEEWEEQTYNA